MAVTADTVQVVMEADVSTYINDLRRADKAFDGVVKNMQTGLTQSGRAFSTLAVGASSSADQVVQSSNRVGAALQKNNLQVGNIAAQFQDIGVTAAAGMNPLIIALQQGTQLSAVLNQSVQGGVSPVKALGTAFLQIINPISLATIAAIALGAAALQSLGSILPASESANEAIKRHKEALEDIVAGYSSAEDAVKQYFDAANQLPQGIATFKTEEQFKKIGEEVEKFRTQMQDFASDQSFSKYGSEATLRMQELAGQFANGDITAEEFYLSLEGVKDELNLLEQAGAAIPGSTANMIAAWQAGAEKAIAFGQAINNLVAASMALASIATDTDLKNTLDLNSYIAEQERLNAMTSEELALYKEIAQIKKDAGQFGITDERAAQLAEQTLAAEKRRADIKKELAQSGRADNTAVKGYEREREALEKLMAAMGLEAALLGQTNREKAIAVAMSKANASATEEEKQAIGDMAAFIYDTEKAIKDLNKSSEEWANTLQGATRSLIDDLIEGKSAAEAFSNVLGSIANKLLDVGLDNLFGSSGFNIAGLFGGKAASKVPSFEGGGSTGMGARTGGLDGKGGFMAMLHPQESVVDHAQVASGGFTFAPVVDARGADEAAVARLETGLRRLANEMVPTIRKEMSSAPKKGRM